MKVKKLGNKGITIVEVVISMALLIVLVLVTLSLATSATSTTNTAILTFRASNQAIDFIEIFQESDDEEEFKNLIERVYGVEYNIENNNSISVIKNGVKSNILIIDNAIIINSYSESNPDNHLYEYTYWKGE